MAYVLQQSDSFGSVGVAARACVHNGTYLYVIKSPSTTADSSLEVLTYNESTDTLSLVESFANGLIGVFGVRDVIYNGKYLIVAGLADIGVFEHTLGSLVKKDEIVHGLATNTKLATDGNYLYLLGDTSIVIRAYRVDTNGNISYVAQSPLFGYRPGSIAADASFIYVNEHQTNTNSAQKILTFNGIAFTVVASLQPAAISYGGVIPTGNNRFVFCRENTTYLYDTSWNLLDSISLGINQLAFDGTYVIGVKHGSNQICTVSVANDELSIVSVVSYSGGGDPVDLSWWKNKIFTVAEETVVRAYKNAVTGIANVSPLVAKAPAEITFSVS